MKLQTAYGLKEIIRDGRKLTLQMDWHHLTEPEVALVKKQLRQVWDTLLGGQKMLYAETERTFRLVRCYRHIPWQKKINDSLELRGFVRTQESVRAQKKRVKNMVRKEIENDTISSFPKSPFFHSVSAQTAALTKKVLTEESKDYTLRGLPEEVIFSIQQSRYPDGSYRIQSSISISGYAIGYALEELTEGYKKQLQNLRKKTPLFAGYIVYEMIPQSVHSYLYCCPQKKNGLRTEASGLEGYEWAAFINKRLAKELPEAHLEQLQQIADVFSEEDGIFYQNRCGIAQYGVQQKRHCRNAIYPILQPGYGYFESNLIRRLQMETVYEDVYFLQKDKDSQEEQPFMIGFFCKTTPEEAVTSRFYESMEKIAIPE